MQQVTLEAFADATAVDPARLPAILSNPGRKALNNASRTWVLHRRLVIRGVFVALLCAGAAGVYALRDRIGVEWGNAYDWGERELATSQFGIKQISITGQDLTDEKTILAALDITPETSMVNFDADAARTAIENLPAVASVTIRKGYPDHLYISIVERVPVARWRLDGVTYAIDQTGAKIAANGDDYPNLPLVVGEDAGDDAMAMTRALAQFPALNSGLVALSRIADRRWDMIYKSGLRVQLPEQGIAQALAQLVTLEQKFQLLERDVTIVDLRVPNVVEVRPSDDAAKQLDAIAKANIAKNKGSFKEDADYSAPAR